MSGDTPAASSAEPSEAELFIQARGADWEKMQSGLRARRKQAGLAGASDGDAEEDEDDGDDPLHTERRKRPELEWQDESEPLCDRTCKIIFAVTLLLLVAASCAAYYFHRFPFPLSCGITNVRPQKFKIDVTEFFAPTVSAAVQGVLSVKNGNYLRSLLLEGLTLTVYEAETGLKLGEAKQGSLHISHFSSTQVTLAVTRLGSSLPPPQQQRLATEFLRHKALLLTFVVTVTSRLPIKGSQATQTTTNATRKVDFSGLYKDPFFQRAPAAPVPPPPEDMQHDVPI